MNNIGFIFILEMHSRYFLLPGPRSLGSAMTILGTLLACCLAFLGYKAVTRGKNKLPHGQYTSDPQYVYRLWTPYKMTSRGAD